MATKIPKRALSIVPAVVGETNLFWVKCCIINPQILLVAPTRIKQIVRGKRVASKICKLCPFNWSNSDNCTFDTPMNNEILLKITNNATSRP